MAEKGVPARINLLDTFLFANNIRRSCEVHVDDDGYMALALEEASRAADIGEVPIGAVVVVGDEVVGRAHNLRESLQDPTAHAEMLALRQASSALKSWRLCGATLYVTLEPCIMCMGAAILARVERIVFGAMDPKGGAAGSLYDLSCDERLNHRIALCGGVREEECASLLTSFFGRLREKKGASRKITRPVETSGGPGFVS